MYKTPFLSLDLTFEFPIIQKQPRKTMAFEIYIYICIYIYTHTYIFEKNILKNSKHLR